MFARVMPGCSVLFSQQDRAELTALAEQLWRQGELLDFELDDLVTAGITVIWRKPTD
jgi:hypothetical protein